MYSDQHKRSDVNIVILYILIFPTLWSHFSIMEYISSCSVVLFISTGVVLSLTKTNTYLCIYFWVLFSHLTLNNQLLYNNVHIYIANKNTLSDIYIVMFGLFMWVCTNKYTTIKSD
jgi:hypothetical protein